MKKRVITATIMVLVLLPILFIGSYPMIALVMFMSFMGTYELVRMHINKSMSPKRYLVIIPIIASLSTGALSLYYYLGCNDSSVLTIIGLVFLILIVLLLITPIFDKNLKIKDAFSFICYILYGGLTFSFMAKLRFIDVLDNNTWVLSISKLNVNLLGLAIVGYGYLTSAMTDVFAQLGGMLLGKHKLCPTISPKKTVEGSICGSLMGSVIGTIVILVCQRLGNFTLLPINNLFLNIIVIFLITLVLTIFAQLGDLVASLIKREYDIKDYGNILPGHGGILDRFDSSIMVFMVLSIILTLIFTIGGM